MGKLYVYQRIFLNKILHYLSLSNVRSIWPFDILVYIKISQEKFENEKSFLKL